MVAYVRNERYALLILHTFIANGAWPYTLWDFVSMQRVVKSLFFKIIAVGNL